MHTSLLRGILFRSFRGIVALMDKKKRDNQILDRYENGEKQAVYR